VVSRDQPPVQERNEAEPSWEGKVLGLNAALAKAGVPYAFGGAIALNYHREPRSTLDVDINIFLTPDNREPALTALRTLYEPDEARIGRDLETQGQTRSMWGDTYVDLFFTDTAFHRSMAENVSCQPFGEAQIPVISAEDLLICKVLYDRPKDWVDIEAVAKTRGAELNTDYMRSWLSEAIGEADPRMDRMDGLLSE